MTRKPVYYFKTLDETGITSVPADSLVIVENGDNGNDLEIYVLDTDPSLISTTTLRKYLQNNKALYKYGGFDNRENEKKIKENKKNIAINTGHISDNKTLSEKNEKDIIMNEKDILKNENNIGYNRVQIDRNTKGIDKVERDNIQQGKNIDHNHHHIDHNEKRIIVLEGANQHKDSVLIEVDKSNTSYPLSTPVKESEIQKIYDDYFPKATWPQNKFPSFIVSQYISFKTHPADILETKYNLRWIKVVMNKGMFAQEYAMISQMPNHTTTKNAHIAPIVSYIVL